MSLKNLSNQTLAKLWASSGHIRALGLAYEVDEEALHVSMVVGPEHSGRPGIAHGGAVMSLMDTALGCRALVYARSQDKATSTVEMKVNFLKPAKEGVKLVVDTAIQSAGRSLLVVSGAARDAQSGERIAFAVGTFNLYSSTKRPSSPEATD